MAIPVTVAEEHRTEVPNRTARGPEQNSDNEMRGFKKAK